MRLNMVPLPMESNAPQLVNYCWQLDPDVVIIDIKRLHRGWDELSGTPCHTCTLKTAKVEAFIREHPKTLKLVEKGVHGAPAAA